MSCWEVNTKDCTLYVYMIIAYIEMYSQKKSQHKYGIYLAYSILYESFLWFDGYAVDKNWLYICVKFFCFLIVCLSDTHCLKSLWSIVSLALWWFYCQIVLLIKISKDLSKHSTLSEAPWLLLLLLYCYFPC